MLFRICYNFIYLSIMCIGYMIQYCFALFELFKKAVQFGLFPLYIDNKLNWLIYRRTLEVVNAVLWTLGQSILSQKILFYYIKFKLFSVENNSSLIFLLLEYLKRRLRLTEYILKAFSMICSLSIPCRQKKSESLRISYQKFFQCGHQNAGYFLQRSL